MFTAFLNDHLLLVDFMLNIFSRSLSLFSAGSCYPVANAPIFYSLWANNKNDLGKYEMYLACKYKFDKKINSY